MEGERSIFMNAESYIGSRYWVGVDPKSNFYQISCRKIERALERWGFGDEFMRLVQSVLIFDNQLPVDAATSPHPCSVVLDYCGLEIMRLPKMAEVLTRLADNCTFSWGILTVLEGEGRTLP